MTRPISPAERHAMRDMLRAGARLHDIRRLTGAGLRTVAALSRPADHPRGGKAGR